MLGGLSYLLWERVRSGGSCRDIINILGFVLCISSGNYLGIVWELLALGNKEKNVKIEQ